MNSVQNYGFSRANSLRARSATRFRRSHGQKAATNLQIHSKHSRAVFLVTANCSLTVTIMTASHMPRARDSFQNAFTPLTHLAITTTQQGRILIPLYRGGNGQTREESWTGPTDTERGRLWAAGGKDRVEALGRPLLGDPEPAFFHTCLSCSRISGENPIG